MHRLIHSVTTTQISANINILMHGVSSGLHGILVLNNPIASEGLRLPDPLLQRFNTEGGLSKSQICP